MHLCTLEEILCKNKQPNGNIIGHTQGRHDIFENYQENVAK